LNRDSIDPVTKQGNIIGKGSKPRVVFFNAECLAWTNLYLEKRKDSHPALFVTYGDQPSRLKRGDIPRFFRAIAKAAGVEKHFTLIYCGIPSVRTCATTAPISA